MGCGSSTSVHPPRSVHDDTSPLVKHVDSLSLDPGVQPVLTTQHAQAREAGKPRTETAKTQGSEAHGTHGTESTVAKSHGQGMTVEELKSHGASKEAEKSHGAEEKDVDSTEEALDPSKIWLTVLSNKDVPLGKQSAMKNLVIRRSGWKTVRIFVSSTFKDLTQEREVLVKQVFPDLRIWCEKRRIHLVECDLRWGIPKDTTSENTLRMCLGEIDRCYKDNYMPFFLNLTSERIGWIPDPGEVPQSLVDEYRWVFGLSMTEMEIVHGAYRKNNPNSLFMIRREQFLDKVPPTLKAVFLDENPIAPAKIQVLKRMIEQRFPPEQIHHYQSEFIGMDDVHQIPKLEFDETFRNRVYEFFKERIERQYPFQMGMIVDPYVVSNEAHESFMKQRANMVFGRDPILREIRDYLTDFDSHVPLVLGGDAGSGKSSIMARAVQDSISLAEELPVIGDESDSPEPRSWTVFYHFVGAVPGSTSLEHTLNRLLKHVQAVKEGDMPKDLEAVASLCCGVLSNPTTQPVMIFIDAINQWDSSNISEFSSWLPKRLASTVRVVLSMIDGTVHYTKLMSRPEETLPLEVKVTALDEDAKKTIVSEYLQQYNKRLDDAQMTSLMAKESSSSPLWLSIACEELRVFGNYREVENKINSLADGLPEIISQVLDRFESEWDGSILVATLCLLEVSRRGLLESELLLILADEDTHSEHTHSEGKEKAEKETLEKEKSPYQEKLPAMKWAGVYRLLKQFIRPFGDAGDGRLDFYHRTMSKAVRRKYFGVCEDHPDGKDEEYVRWHTKLAKFFRHEQIWERKCEEFPTHLIYLGWWDELAEFLCDWRTVDVLYNKDYATELHGYIKKMPSSEHDMWEKYTELVFNLVNDGSDKRHIIKRTVQIAHLMQQVGRYNEALALTTRPEQWVEEDLDLQSDTLLLADLYHIIAKILDGKQKASEFLYRSGVPEAVKILHYMEKCLELRRNLVLTDPKQKLMLAQTLNLYAFTLCSMANLGGNAEYPVQTCRDRAKECSTESKDIFTELGDMGRVADSLQNLAMASTSRTEQKEYYSDALDLCLRAYGEHHELTSRIQLNFGIYYEEGGDYYAAYDLFNKCFYGQSEVLGVDHIRSMRPRKILIEPMYRRIAREKGDPLVPATV